MMIWAVVSMLLTRAWNNYVVRGFYIGKGEWHVAHVLFGGIVMVAGMMLVIIFHGEKVKRTAVVIFGIGLGWFVDEFGKYLSIDNNMNFQPAVMIVYIFFIVMFLVYRYLEKVNPKDPRTLMFQVISNLEEMVENGLNKDEKSRMLFKLKKVIAEGKEDYRRLAKQIWEVVKKEKLNNSKAANWWKGTWSSIRKVFYHRIFRKKFVLTVLMMLAVVFTIGSAVDLAILTKRYQNSWFIDNWPAKTEIDSRGEVYIYALKVLSDVAASILYVGGIWWVVKKRRIRGINYFRYGLLVNIFLASVFRFYFEQLSAVFALLVSIVVYYGLGQLKEEVGLHKP